MQDIAKNLRRNQLSFLSTCFLLQVKLCVCKSIDHSFIHSFIQKLHYCIKIAMAGFTSNGVPVYHTYSQLGAVKSSQSRMGWLWDGSTNHCTTGHLYNIRINIWHGNIWALYLKQFDFLNDEWRQACNDMSLSQSAMCEVAFYAFGNRSKCKILVATLSLSSY